MPRTVPHSHSRSVFHRLPGAAACVLFALLSIGGFGHAPALAQPAAPCGIVDALDYPIEIEDTLRDGYDDFALYRPRFGGNHVGIDIGFNRWGEPVYAVARGRVTYSDILGWDTEKGVVIIEHTFPDGSIAYSLYGHVEQGDTVFLPTVGECVERGDIVGLIGWPSRGLPHLHYELRDFLPDDGGPGYVTDNPLLTGWYHPLDFTMQWRVRLQPGFIGAATYSDVPSLPPALIDSGITVVAAGSSLAAFNPAGASLWRVAMGGAVTGIAALPGDRVAARSRDGQTVVMSASTGRYLALWPVEGPDTTFVVSGERLFFLTDEGGIAAFTALGEALWTLPPAGILPGEGLRLVLFEVDAVGHVALAVRGDADTLWRLIDGDGVILHETTFERPPAFAPLHDGGWLALEGAALYRLSAGGADTPFSQTELARISPSAGRTARLTTDIVGNVYIYLGDAGDTLLSLDAHGNVRWRAVYPAGRSSLAPLMDVGGGCTLYTLDADGMLNVFDSGTGELVAQRHLYPGGVQNGSPRARILRVDAGDRILVSAGFLSAVTLDGTALGRSCLLG